MQWSFFVAILSFICIDTSHFNIFAHVGQQGHQGGGQNQQQGGFGKILNCYFLYCLIMGKETITEIRLFKYTENFTSKTDFFQIKKKL